jgi:hypothetical protein
MKKFLSLFFLVLSYSILLGHDVIPHHHHEDSHHQALPVEHNDDEAAEDWLVNMFSNVAHFERGLTLSKNSTLSHFIAFNGIEVIGDLPDDFALKKYLIPPLLHFISPTSLFFLTYPFSNFGLRGPPNFNS